MPDTPSAASAASEVTEVSTLVGDEDQGSNGSALASGVRIGRFVVLREVGRGGMGVVFAGYDDQLDRKVAIKLLRRRTEAAARRLAREAQALAKLSHPNVVQVYEIGTDDGGVFIAMEFVEGQTLAAWARARRCSWRESLALLLEAGRGLAAAHHKSLVHRDFKPDNVMVDDEGRVRVMDFGLVHGALEHEHEHEDDDEDRPPARAARSRDSVEQRLTETGSAMGTPAYMAPEQHAGLATDARSDQFSFCVTAWELLHGQRPHAGQTLAALFLAVTEEQLREPPRDTEVPSWIRRVLARGLAADPSERWPDMDSLLAALSHDPRRRWRLGFAAVSVVVAGLAIVGGRNALAARERAQLAAECAQQGEAASEVWNSSLAATLEPGFVAGRGPAAAESWSRTRAELDRYADAWATLRTETCRAEALDGRISGAQRAAVDACLDDAKIALVAAVELLHEPNPELVAYAARLPHKLPRVAACSNATSTTRVSGGDPEAIAELRAQLQHAASRQLVGGYAEAKRLAVDLGERAVALERPDLEAEALLLIGDANHALGDYDGANQAYERAFTAAIEEAADDLALRAASSNLVVLGNRLGRYELARVWTLVAGSMVARVGPGSLDAAGYYVNAASLERDQGEFEDALSKASEGLERYREALGAQHPDIAAPLLVKASIHRGREEFAAALELGEAALDLRERAYGPDHPDVADTLDAIASIHEASGALDLAEAASERALAIRERVFGPDHPDVADSLSALARLAMYQGRNAAARDLFERALAIHEAALGPDHTSVGIVADNLAIVLLQLGEFEAAVAYNLRALRISEQVFGPDHPRVAAHLSNQTQYLLELGRYDEAEAAISRALAITEARLGPRHSDVGTTRVGLGSVYEAKGELREALAEYRRGLSILEAVLGEDHFELSDTLWLIGNIHRELGELDLAREAFERSLALDVAAGAVGGRTAETRLDLGEIAWALGDREEARTHVATAKAELEAIAEPPAELLERARAWTDAHAAGSRPAPR